VRRLRRGRSILLALGIVVVLFATACSSDKGKSTKSTSTALGIHKIKHVIVIMQENRSYDNYFGTYPGADGIPMANGKPVACLYPPKGPCVSPFEDHEDVNGDGPHNAPAAYFDVNGGKMDGFYFQAVRAKETHDPKDCTDDNDPNCGRGDPKGVMGYHTKSDLPNYWAYAENYVLHDHMFAAVSSWSLPAHLSMVSGWSAKCPTHDPMSCKDALQAPAYPNTAGELGKDFKPKSDDPIYAWTDLTYLLHKNDVSWGYYVASGKEADCEDAGTLSCSPRNQNAATPGIWSPLPYFDTVQQNKQLDNIQSVDNFYKAAKDGTLPAVSWVIPSGEVSEHAPAPVSFGQSYVTALINAAMSGPDWDSTAIFLSWDEWGGFYDHVRPPSVDANGYGVRVPSLVISPYAKKGYVDDQVLSHDAYLKFIEDAFLDGQRLDPTTDGRPDRRPTVREDVAILGDLRRDFDFNQEPRKPMLLPVYPKTTLKNTPGPSPFAKDTPGVLPSTTG
jgi:phospholipase C